MAVKIGNLAREIMKQLDDYGVEVGLEVEKVSKEVAEDTAKMLNKNSPKRTGDYAASWTYGVGDTKRTRHTMVVHAEKPEYALAHLLEKGHQNREGGRTKAIVHIAPAEEAAVDQLEKELRKRL
nr:HK97 gp10 family phage protein [uncultured Blautia sp.]